MSIIWYLYSYVYNIYCVWPIVCNSSTIYSTKSCTKMQFFPFRDGSAQALLSSASCNAASARSLPEMQRTTRSIWFFHSSMALYDCKHDLELFWAVKMLDSETARECSTALISFSPIASTDSPQTPWSGLAASPWTGYHCSCCLWFQLFPYWIMQMIWWYATLLCFSWGHGTSPWRC